MLLLAIKAEFLFISSSSTVFGPNRHLHNWVESASIERATFSLRDFFGSVHFRFSSGACADLNHTWYPYFKVTGLSLKLEPPAALIKLILPWMPAVSLETGLMDWGGIYGFGTSGLTHRNQLYGISLKVATRVRVDVGKGKILYRRAQIFAPQNQNLPYSSEANYTVHLFYDWWHGGTGIAIGDDLILEILHKEVRKRFNLSIAIVAASPMAELGNWNKIDLYHYINLMFKPAFANIEIIEEEGNGYVGIGANLYQLVALSGGIYFEDILQKPGINSTRAGYIRAYMIFEDFEGTILYRSDGKILAFVATKK